MAKPWAKSFYNSRLWQDTRRLALQRDRYTCQDCGYRAEEVHHIIELTAENINDVNISLNIENLMCLCRECHARHTHKISAVADEYIFDSDGYVSPHSKT